MTRTTHQQAPAPATESKRTRKPKPTDEQKKEARQLLDEHQELAKRQSAAEQTAQECFDKRQQNLSNVLAMVGSGPFEINGNQVEIVKKRGVGLVLVEFVARVTRL